MNTKELHFLHWSHFGAGLFSTCARHQYMALITDRHGRVIGTGYNGSPPGSPHCKDGHCPHLYDPPEKSSALSHNCIAIHAEANALMYSDHAARQGGTLYVNGLPCVDCAKMIAGAGLARVVCMRRGTWTDGVAVLARHGLDVVLG